MARRPFVFLGLLITAIFTAIAAMHFGSTEAAEPPTAAASATTTPASASPSPASASPSTGPGAIPGNQDSVVSAETAAGAVCAVVPSQLEGFIKATPRSPALENLRDGLPLLRDRLVELEQAARGRPVLRPLTTRVTRIRDSWARALKAHDAGRDRAARAAMSQADRQIKGLRLAVGKAFAGSSGSCKA